MKFETCLKCEQLGKTCDGPNFLAMEPAELGNWCNEKRKENNWMTYDKIAADTGISKSTVYSFLHGEHSDYRLETVKRIVKYVTGGKWDDNPCGNISNAEREQMKETIRKKEEEIQRHLKSINFLKAQFDIEKQQIDFFQLQAKNRRRTIIVLGTFLFILMSLIIVQLLKPGNRLFLALRSVI